MTALLEPQARDRGDVIVHAEGRAGGAVVTAVEQLVPAHLLDGDEIVIFAIKPSPWYILIVSLKWIVAGVFLALLAGNQSVPVVSRWYLYQLAFWLTGARLAWATLDWVSRLYVLTNRRVMRIRGVFNVELFECGLDRLQNTYLNLSISERITHTGTLTFQTAGTAASASWRIIARPLEVHEKLREAIRRSKNRGNHVL